MLLQGRGTRNRRCGAAVRRRAHRAHPPTPPEAVVSACGVPDLGKDLVRDQVRELLLGMRLMPLVGRDVSPRTRQAAVRPPQQWRADEVKVSELVNEEPGRARRGLRAVDEQVSLTVPTPRTKRPGVHHKCVAPMIFGPHPWNVLTTMVVHDRLAGDPTGQPLGGLTPDHPGLGTRIGVNDQTRGAARHLHDGSADGLSASTLTSSRISRVLTRSPLELVQFLRSQAGWRRLRRYRSSRGSERAPPGALDDGKGHPSGAAVDQGMPPTASSRPGARRTTSRLPLGEAPARA